ncbi:MAG: winged helix-turn-helix domain-containing protein [Candidatus Thorarchaeota archaeon]
MRDMSTYGIQTKVSIKDLPSRFTTPWDYLIPIVEDTESLYLLNIMRMYLGLHAGTLTYEEAEDILHDIRQTPEYTRYPIDPTLVFVNDHYKNRIVSNLETLHKYRLYTLDAISSAARFSFLTDQYPLRKTDMNVLTEMVIEPLSSVRTTSERIGLSPSTVRRSLSRLREFHQIRYCCLSDNSAFDLHSFMMFYTLRDGVDSDEIEKNFCSLPIHRATLDAATNEQRYTSFLIPGSENSERFIRSVLALPPSVFEYVRLYRAQGVGRTMNLNLLEDMEWRLPISISDLFLAESIDDRECTFAKTLYSRGTRQDLEMTDMIVSMLLRRDFRIKPTDASQYLRKSGYDITPNEVRVSRERLLEKGVDLPVTYVWGLGLSATYSFEIICNPEWSERIQERIRVLPITNTFISHRGIIVMTYFVGHHEVEYYKLFHSLEDQEGIEAVHTIRMPRIRGSRVMLHLPKYWDSSMNEWSDLGDGVDLTRLF